MTTEVARYNALTQEFEIVKEIEPSAKNRFVTDISGGKMGAYLYTCGESATTIIHLPRVKITRGRGTNQGIEYDQCDVKETAELTTGQSREFPVRPVGSTSSILLRFTHKN